MLRPSSPITLTVDLEDPTERYDPAGRYVQMTEKILDLCAEKKCRATFFTVGRVAEVAPDLIRQIASRGHEIAYHSHAHVPLTEEDPARFRDETRIDRDRLEQLTGQSVIGFRAPRFSLTPASRWALDVLVEAGFRYSSSVMPTAVSLYGYPAVPCLGFCWPNGLIELPLPVMTCGKRHIPYLGGIYLYALPSIVTSYGLRRANPAEVMWTYTHPYDFDRWEPIAPMPHTPVWVQIVLRMARTVAESKIRKRISGGTAPPLGERLNERPWPVFSG